MFTRTFAENTAFEIQYTELANQDLNEVLAFIAIDSTPRARRWLDGFIAAVEELKFAPEKFAIATEFQGADSLIRSFHYHSHRIFYEVRGSVIVVHRIWHGARQPIISQDVSTD